MALTSCGKSYQCPKENLAPAFVAYADTEIDTIVLRRFKTGSNFSQQVDSTVLSISNCVFSKHTDTVMLFANDLKNRINDGYDWQVFNPFYQRTISITAMAFKIEESHSGGLFSMDPAACVSPLIFYKRDNTIVTSSPDMGNDYLFIHK